VMWAQVMIRHQYPFECAWLLSGGKFFMALTSDFLLVYISASLKGYSQRLLHAATLGEEICKK